MNILKELLDTKKLSLYKVAKDTNIPYSTLSDIANDKVDIRNMRFEIGLKLAKYLRISPEELIASAIFVDQFGNMYFGRVFEDKGYYFVTFKDFDKKENTIKLGRVGETDFFLQDITTWEMKHFIENQILERWVEFV